MFILLLLHVQGWCDKMAPPSPRRFFSILLDTLCRRHMVMKSNYEVLHHARLQWIHQMVVWGWWIRQGHNYILFLHGLFLACELVGKRFYLVDMFKDGVNFVHLDGETFAPYERNIEHFFGFMVNILDHPRLRQPFTYFDLYQFFVNQIFSNYGKIFLHRHS